MVADFNYTEGEDGLVSIVPNTLDAISTYNSMYSEGVYRLMPHEFAVFKAQARRSGYTVRKAVPVKIDYSDELLLDLIGN